jgi:hypothetical protein
MQKGRKTCDDGGRDRSAAVGGQESQGLPEKLQNSGRGMERFFPADFTGRWSCLHLDLNLKPPEI